MDFVSNVLDAIPVVGHVKGVIHYAAGDKEGGDKAMYQSTRTSAVIAGGVAGGVVGGPAGAIGGAIYSGALTDTLASAAMDKPQGIVKHCENISEDIKHGRNPTVSVVSTSVHLGLDALGGVGMGGLSSATANSVGKKIASNVGEEIFEKSVKITAEEMAKFTAKKATETVVKKTIEKTTEQAVIQAVTVTAHIAERAVLETVQDEIQAKKCNEVKKCERQAAPKEKTEGQVDKEEKTKRDTDQKSSQSKSKTGSGSQPSEQKAITKEKKGEKSNKEKRGKPSMGTGSGSEPPRENKENEKIDECSNADIFSEFLKLLKKILKTICRNVNQERVYNTFENLSPGQRKTVVKLIKRLKYFRTLETVLNVVIEIFDRYYPTDFTFLKFLSMMEFVKAYINDEIEKHINPENNKVKQYLATPSTYNFQQLQTYLITIVTSDSGKIVDAFNDIRAKIESEIAKEPLNSNFRDIFTAVYHYFKHKNIPDDGTLSVSQYYEWIKHFLKIIRLLPAFIRLSFGQNPSNEITLEWYVAEFGRRVRIVIKFENGKTVLASCYFVDTTFLGDEDGDKFINIKNEMKYQRYPWPLSHDPSSSDSDMADFDEDMN